MTILTEPLKTYVTGLPSASSLTGTELFYSVQSNSSVKVTANQIAALIPPPAPSTINGFIYLSTFGVIGGGAVDDTAALNAAFASVMGSGVTVIWDVGFCKTTDTVVIGDATGGAGAPSSFINIYVPKTSQAGGIFYYGPTDGRPALLVAKNKYFKFEGLNVNNQTGVKGTSIGMMLGGAGPGSFGNQVIDAIFMNCGFHSWNIGVTDGNDGAASECEWFGCEFSNNDTGWVGNDFNTIDHTFHMLLMSDNGIGLDTGQTEGFRVLSGSATNNGIDFYIRQNGNCEVNGYRSEASTRFAAAPTSNIGSVLTLWDCHIRTGGGVDQTAISGNFASLDIHSSNFDSGGWISFSGLPGSLKIADCTCRIDPNTKFPFVYTGGDTRSCHVTVSNVADYQNAIPCPDFHGYIHGPTYVGITGTDIFPCEPTIYIPKVSTFLDSGANIGQYGTDYLALNLVRQLSEAPAKGSCLPVTFTAVTNGTTAANNNVLHFASVPSSVTPGMVVTDLSNGIVGDVKVVSTTGTTVTVNQNVGAGGISSGDTIAFNSHLSPVIPGQNLRVSGTFATSGTLDFTFQRSTVSVTSGGDGIFTATSGNFYPSDAGKLLKVAGKGNQGWTDWFGYGVAFIDATHLRVMFMAQQTTVIINTPSVVIIGTDEPDANYMVAGIVGDAATPESYSVTAATAAGFTVKSSNVVSTSTITALIVR